MEGPTRTQITIFAIVIAVLAALGVRAQAWAPPPVAPVLMTCPPGQSSRTTYSYTSGWPMPVVTCGLDVIPGSGPTSLLPPMEPEGFTNPDFNQGGTLIQTMPGALGQPEGITLPDFGTSGEVYANDDSVYAQLFQPNNEESACLSQGGVFSSGMFGSSCAYQSVGGVVEQPGTVVDANGWTADQFGTTVDGVGGTADQMGNVAPGFSNEDAAAAACNAGGNIYVYGQGCDVVVPMGGTVEQSSTVVDMIGSTAPDAGFQAPNLGDPGIDTTYCAMAAGGFGACNPGSLVTGFQLNAKSLKVWENEADWYRSHPQDAPVGFWDEYNQAVNPQPAVPDVATQPASQPAVPDAQNNNNVAAPSYPPAQPQGPSTVVFHQAPGQVFVGKDVSIWNRSDGVVVLTDEQGNRMFVPEGTKITQEPQDSSVYVDTEPTIQNAEIQQHEGYVTVSTADGDIQITGTSAVKQPDGSVVSIVNGQINGGLPEPISYGNINTDRGLTQIKDHIPPWYRGDFDAAASTINAANEKTRRYGGSKGDDYWKAIDDLNNMCAGLTGNARSFNDYCK